jgi:hypothetical protein
MGCKHAFNEAPLRCAINNEPTAKCGCLIASARRIIKLDLAISARSAAIVASQRLRWHLSEERLVPNRESSQFPKTVARRDLGYRYGMGRALKQWTAGEVQTSQRLRPSTWWNLRCN